MDDVLADYGADARDRLWKLLEIQNVGYRDRLRQSADTAGGQLEWLKPSLVGGNRSEFYAGPAVTAPSGTVLVVLAHDAKAFTIQIRPTSERTLTDGVKDAVDYVKEGMREDVDKWSAGALVLAIEDLIKKYGRPPGKKGGELTQEHNVRIIGCLFMGMPDETRADTLHRLEKVSAAGICPAMIGLLGKGSETGLCAVWPLMLGLAPYADRIIKE